MFLKRIDVIGFKSFADKTGIDFSPGMTAVVGPNGSGKSNIADAIRWVLGEQSAKNLRGSKMEDVIFAGTETRRPINFCEVSLTLDNADGHLPVVFDEVTITRRVYRSGESEYMLNKQSCRLKDIMELFMDSGMGRESYSIIGQGKIEEMLSTRAEDRRGPFEDAAGIVKYKFRRRDAERKLEETGANLVRIDDILSELERQAGPLSKEAERATQYKEYEGQLTALDVSLLVREIEALQQRWKDVAGSVQDLSLHRQAMVGELEAKDGALKQAREQFEAKNSETEELQRRLVQGVEHRQRTEGHLDLLRERVKNTESALTDKEGQQAELTREMEHLRAQIAGLETRKSELQAQLEIKSGELEVAANAVDPTVRTRLEEEIERLNAELIESHHQAATLRNELKMSEESLNLDDRKRERLFAERAKWEEEVSKYQAARDHTDAQITQHKAALAVAQQEVEQTSQQLREQAREEAQVVTGIHQLQAEMASLRSRLELLKELEEGYDGYALGVKTVLQSASKQRLQGVHGSVASLIQVPNQYEQAIETALGGTLQNIVVQTEADARAAIDLLKQRHAGRATFMPLSVIRPRSVAAAEIAKAERVTGYVGVASSLVGCEETYRNVVEHLLGNVVITEKLVHANEVARALDYRVRVVTLEGDVVSPGGVMSGGSHARKGPGLLGRSREKSNVESTLADEEQKKREQEQRQQAIRDHMLLLQTQQKQLLERLELSRQEIIGLEASNGELAAHEQNAKDRLNSVIWECDQLASGQAAWTTRVEHAKQGLASVEQQLERIEESLRARRTELEERDRSLSDAQEQLTGLRVEVATFTQEHTALSQQVADVNERLQRLRDREAQLVRDITELQALLVTSRQEAVQTEGSLTEFSNSVSGLEAQLVDVRQARQLAEAAVVAADKAFRAQQLSLSQAEEQFHRAEVQAERTDAELKHALHKMGETYHMTYEWAREHYPSVTDVEETKRTAERLRRQIAALGDVQVGAIEEWNRLSERMSFLQRERKDLDDARVQLETVIAEIDEEMSRRFAQAFEQIRSEFQVSFRKLFGGGRADLELTNPNDLLTTGIDVIAQPPGKKLQNLNLMSGGERALIAMALLFAILKVRPVPFCVLDEVEAALDEANVSRFAQHLRLFSDETQFIVITHRRGTMEEADALYGVTMQESGVSSLIGVRLGDADFDMDTA